MILLSMGVDRADTATDRFGRETLFAYILIAVQVGQLVLSPWRHSVTFGSISKLCVLFFQTLLSMSTFKSHAEKWV